MSCEAASRDLTAVEATLADAERKGFRLAVFGRMLALIPIGVVHPLGYQYPNNIYIAAAILAAIAVGLLSLALIDTRYERVSRYALFGFDRPRSARFWRWPRSAAAAMSRRTSCS